LLSLTPGLSVKNSGERRDLVVFLDEARDLYSEPVQDDYLKKEGFVMTVQTTYSNARANFASLLDRVTANREIVIINRRGSEDVALVAASELSSLLETAHLLRSPKNARRLFESIAELQAGGGTEHELID